MPKPVILSREVAIRLHKTLLRCAPVDSNASLRNVFAAESLRPWKNSLPDADSPRGRVDTLIAYLLDKYNVAGESALASFLLVLRDLTDDEQCRAELDALVADIPLTPLPPHTSS